MSRPSPWGPPSSAPPIIGIEIIVVNDLIIFFCIIKIKSVNAILIIIRLTIVNIIVILYGFFCFCTFFLIKYVL